MEYEFRMANIMGLLKYQNTSKPHDNRKARIIEDELPVCTIFNKKNCYDPDSLKKAFHPLGIYSKIFGLFPCYDFTFSESTTTDACQNSRRRCLMHCLDYLYSAFIFSFLTGGAIFVHIYKPRILEQSQEDMDYFVKLAVIYAKIIAGVQSLFIFPMKWNGVLNFVQLMSNIDKILRFDGREEERGFAFKVLLYMVGSLVFTLGSFMVLFVYDGNDATPCVMDYLMVPVVTLALNAVVIPTGLAIFFLGAIRLRMEHFNRKMSSMLKHLIPSCETCIGFTDYGSELDASQVEKYQMEILPDNLEKMRILHCEIRTLGNCMSCIFGMHLVRDFLYSMVALVLYTYLLLYLEKGRVIISMIYAGHGIFLILKILTLVCYTQLICYQGIVLDGILQRVSLCRVNESCCAQIQAFLGVASSPPTINAAGFFSINKALMTSIVASITTYFIILMQFKINDDFYGSSSSENNSSITSTTTTYITYI